MHTLFKLVVLLIVGGFLSPGLLQALEDSSATSQAQSVSDSPLSPKKGAPPPQNPTLESASIDKTNEQWLGTYAHIGYTLSDNSGFIKIYNKTASIKQTPNGAYSGLQIGIGKKLFYNTIFELNYMNLGKMQLQGSQGAQFGWQSSDKSDVYTFQRDGTLTVDIRALALLVIPTTNIQAATGVNLDLYGKMGLYSYQVRSSGTAATNHGETFSQGTSTSGASLALGFGVGKHTSNFYPYLEFMLLGGDLLALGTRYYFN